LYDGGILKGDQRVAEILQALDDAGLRGNTIIVVAADHGEALAEDGKTVEHQVVCEEVMHTPLIISGPNIPKGVRVSEMTENVDIVPTLVNILHLQTSAEFNGRNLADVWSVDASQKRAPRDYALALSHDGYDFIMRGEGYAFEKEIQDKESNILYQEPFSIAHLENVASANPHVVGVMKTRMLKALMPYYTEAIKRPLTSPTTPFFPNIVSVFPADAAVKDPPGLWESHVDPPAGKWLILNNEKALFAAKEEIPSQILVKYATPNGKYHVKLTLRLEKDLSEPFGGVQMQVQKQPVFRPIAGESENSLLDLGEHEVVDSTFQIMLKVDSPSSAFMIGPILFIPSDLDNGNAMETRDELLNSQDKLQSLGYL
jgi:hypothetical protein